MKKAIVWIIIILIILVAGWYFMSANGQQEVDVSTDTNAQEQGTDQNSDTDLGTGGTETGGYSIVSGSSVSYTVQKEFFGKPTEEVTGTTSDVSGSVSFNSETREISVSATANPQTLDSGSEDRDDYVRKQFTSDISMTLESFNVESESLEEISATVPVQLTMNGIAKTVDFQVEGSISESGVEARGSASINMTDFNIKPASLASVYEVAEVAEISFVLMAQ